MFDIVYFSVTAGEGATAYDVVINPDFLNELGGRQVLLGFLITVILEGLEFKYEMSLSRGKRLLKKRDGYYV